MKKSTKSTRSSSRSTKSTKTIRKLSSDTPLQERIAIARRLGLFTFGGNRLLHNALGYQEVLTPYDYRLRYERNAIAARVVEAFPKATWRGGGELVEDEDPETETPFERKWLDVAQRLNIWSTCLRSDILAGMGRYSILLIGAPGKVNSPLPQGTSDQLAYLMPFAEESAKIAKWVSDPTDPRFGLPETYALTRKSVNGSPGLVDREVHWSRIIHLTDNPLDDLVFSPPRLERCWNLLDDLEKVTGGGAEAFWMRAHQGYQFDLDKDMDLDPEDEVAFAKEVDEFVNNMKRVVKTRGVKMNTTSSDVANFNGPADAILTQIAGGLGIPKRILTGSEVGSLASTQDKGNWEDQVGDRQKSFAAPIVVRPLVDRLIKFGYLPKPKRYEVRWPSIDNYDDMQRAEIAKKWSETNDFDHNFIVVEENEIRDRVLNLPPKEVSQITVAPNSTSLSLQVAKFKMRQMRFRASVTYNATKKKIQLVK